MTALRIDPTIAIQLGRLGDRRDKLVAQYKLAQMEAERCATDAQRVTTEIIKLLHAAGVADLKHAKVITDESEGYPVGTVVHMQTNQPIEAPEPSPPATVTPILPNRQQRRAVKPKKG